MPDYRNELGDELWDDLPGYGCDGVGIPYHAEHEEYEHEDEDVEKVFPCMEELLAHLQGLEDGDAGQCLLHLHALVQYQT